MRRMVVLAALALARALAPAAAPASAAQAAPAAADDVAAVAAYRAGDYESARTAWLELLERDAPRVEGAERARLLYDLGNCAARDEDWLAAVGWYTASLRLRPRDADAWANLELARMEAGLDPADRGDLSATLDRLLGIVTPAESRGVALLALLPLLVALVGEALRGGRAWRAAALLGLAVAALGAAPWLYQLGAQDERPVLIVAERGARLRSEPRPDATPLESVEAGARAEELDGLPGWTKLELESGARGWVRADEAFRLAR